MKNLSSYFKILGFRLLENLRYKMKVSLGILYKSLSIVNVLFLVLKILLYRQTGSATNRENNNIVYCTVHNLILKIVTHIQMEIYVSFYLIILF